MNILSYNDEQIKETLQKFNVPQLDHVNIKHKKTLTPDSWIVRIDIDEQKYALYEEDHFEDLGRVKTEIENTYDFAKVLHFVRAADATADEANEALAFTVEPDKDDDVYNVILLAALSKV